MKKLKLYLDTSVLNFLFAEDAPDFKKITIDFFDNYVAKGEYDVFISDVVIKEIEKAPDESTRNLLLNAARKYSLRILLLTPEAIGLSERYLADKIIPAKKREDAQHIAIAVCNQIDVLVSWNFKHLANINKQVLINSINEKEGYLKRLNLLSPLEVVYDEE